MPKGNTNLTPGKIIHPQGAKSSSTDVALDKKRGTKRRRVVK